MSNQTDTILRESTADMWQSERSETITNLCEPLRTSVPKKRNVRRTSAVVASVAVVAMTMAAEAHHRRHSARPMQVMCDNVDLMRPCYNGYRPFAVDRPQHVATLSKSRHHARRREPTRMAAHHHRHEKQKETQQTEWVPMHNLVMAARAHLGTNPTGWAHVWCGKFMSLIAPQAAAKIDNPNAARNWAQLPSVGGCRVGAVAVMPHHVGVVSECNGRKIRMVSGNSVGHRVAETDISSSRIIAFVKAE